MRVIITGGTGLIGSALAESYALNGNEVIVLSRNPQKHQAELPEGVRAIAWDGSTAQGWGHLADGADVIVNLAGESLAGENFWALLTKRLTPNRKRTIVNSRVNAGKAVLQAIQEAQVKPKVLVQASAVGYYGSRGDQILTEETPPGTDFGARVCIDWEDSTRSVEALGVRRVVIRTAGVTLSLKGGAFPFMLLPYRLFLGGKIASGRQYFSWIHLSDEVRAIRFLIESPEAQGVFNLSAPQQLTNAEFSRITGQVMKRPAFLPLPAIFFRLLFGQKAEILLASQRQDPNRLLEMGFQFLFPTPEAALTDLLT